jgi:hypothetical protein
MHDERPVGTDRPAAPDPVPGRRRPVRRAVELGRWAVGMGVGLATWPFTRVPLYRRNRRRFADSERQPRPAGPIPGDRASLQRLPDGVGPVYHRRYWIDLTDAEHGPEEVIAALSSDLNVASPVEIARFDKVGGGGRMAVGDEYVVRLPGPWNGPVRVVDVTDRSFRFVTLRGHVEAGEIEFRCDEIDRGCLRFQIESWARSRDRAVNWLYDRVAFARELQLHTWSHFCERIVDVAGATPLSKVEVMTERIRPEEIT